MSLITSDINAWPSANATEVARWDSWEDANAWMQKDKANRLVEGLVQGNGTHKQVLWERVDKTKPIGFKRGKAHTPGKRGLSFYVATQQNSELQPPAGGCLFNQAVFDTSNKREGWEWEGR